jgi:hypothetical protein
MSAPYRPANGMEGALFMARFCDQCARDTAFRDGTGDSCPIAAASCAFGVDDPEYPKEWQHDMSGPFCTAFQPEVAHD